MTDIAALIDRARKTAKCVYLIGEAGPCADVSDCITQLAAALSRLTTPPLPDEIAGLIERADKLTDSPPRYFRRTMWESLLEEMAAALRALAQENERLTVLWRDADDRAYQQQLCIRELEAIVAQIQPPNDIGDNCTVELAVKCAELEAERDEWKATAETVSMLRDKAITEACDAIEEKIESHYSDKITKLENEATNLARQRNAIRAKTFEECAIHVVMFLQSRIGEQAAAAIRALAHTDESKTESSE